MGPEQLIKKLRSTAGVLQEEGLPGLAHLLYLAALAMENQAATIQELQQSLIEGKGGRS